MMANRSPGFHITNRDLETLSAQDAMPLTANQLLIYSHTFQQPFTHLRVVQRRLKILENGGLIKSFPYAVASDGRSPKYYKLTRSGYRVLHGFDAVLPNRRYFERIADNRHFHTRCLVDFLIHLAVRCQQQGIILQRLARENSVVIKSGAATLFPDAAFQLQLPGGRCFNFVVELDNGTERIRSSKDAESITRKIRGYDQHQSEFEAFSPQRYVVLFVTTRSRERLDRMLVTARTLSKNPQRRVFLGTCLDEFLTTPSDHQAGLLFYDVQGKQCPIVEVRSRKKTSSKVVTSPATLC